MSTLWALTPSHRPVGGVVKILDYVQHALDLGYDAVLASARGVDPESPLWRMAAFAGMPDDPRVRLLDDLRIAPSGDDVVLLSWPSHVVDVVDRLPDGFPLAQVVHLVQNTRHANPTFADGWGVRALARPMTRIMINEVVHDAVAPLLNPECRTRVIPLGHRAEHFAYDRPPGLPPVVTVGYTTWKSDVGHRVAAALEHDGRFAFRAVTGPADWDELRDLYTGSDVFLSTPGPQEGFYLPGLEAMAARAVVLSPDAEGNLAYCWFGTNCVEVALEDADSYVDALRDLVTWSPERVETMRDAGAERVAAHDLLGERRAFGELLDEVRGDDGPRVRSTTWAVPARRAEPAFTILTGVPRSGTTLAVRLLNSLPGTVAMDEPLRPAELMPLGRGAPLLDAVEKFFVDQRRTAREDGTVTSKVVAGSLADNHAVRTAEAALRVDPSEWGTLRLDRTPPPDATYVVKDLALSTAVLPDLLRRFHVVAMVRNPVAVLASWETVDMPFRHGHAPHAEWYDERLARRLDVEDRHERQLRLLEWWFGQYATHLGPGQVVRYEDLVAGRGRPLGVLVPEAESLDAELVDHNLGDTYADVDLSAVVARVLSRQDAPWWVHYDRREVEALRPHDPAAHADAGRDAPEGASGHC